MRFTRDQETNLDEWRDQMARDLAQADSFGQAIRLAIGTASACWSNLAGAGTFESERARVLADVLTAHASKYASQLEEQLAQRDTEIAKRIERNRELRAEVDELEVERDQYRNGAHNMAAENARFVDRNKALTEQLAQRDTEITKRRERNRQLRARVELYAGGDRAQLVDQVEKLTADRDQLRDDRDEANSLVASLITARDKANHRHRAEKARAERYLADAAYAEHRLELIEAAIRAPRPTPSADTGDSWAAFGHERAELGDQLANTASPGPRPGPTPAQPHDVEDQDHDPAGYPFTPDYTAADLDAPEPAPADPTEWLEVRRQVLDKLSLEDGDRVRPRFVLSALRSLGYRVTR